MEEYPFWSYSRTVSTKSTAPLTYHLGRSTIQGTQADIDRRLAAMGLAVKRGRDE